MHDIMMLEIQNYVLIFFPKVLKDKLYFLFVCFGNTLQYGFIC